MKYLQEHLLHGKGPRVCSQVEKGTAYTTARNLRHVHIGEGYAKFRSVGKSLWQHCLPAPCHPATGSPRPPCLLGWHRHLPSAGEGKDLLTASEAREENPAL